MEELLLEELLLEELLLEELILEELFLEEFLGWPPSTSSRGALDPESLPPTRATWGCIQT